MSETNWLAHIEGCLESAGDTADPTEVVSVEVKQHALKTLESVLPDQAMLPSVVLSETEGGIEFVWRGFKTYVSIDIQTVNTVKATVRSPFAMHDVFEVPFEDAADVLVSVLAEVSLLAAARQTNASYL